MRQLPCFKRENKSRGESLRLFFDAGITFPFFAHTVSVRGKNFKKTKKVVFFFAKVCYNIVIYGFLITVFDIFYIYERIRNIAMKIK